MPDTPRTKFLNCEICEISLHGTHCLRWCKECQTVTFNCDQCGQEATQPRTKYNRSKSHFCSRTCGNIYGWQIAGEKRRKPIKVKCPQCGTINIKNPTKAKRLFCNRTCSIAYRRTHLELYPHHPMTQAARDKLSQERTGEGNPGYGKLGQLSPHWKGGRDSYRGKGWKTVRKIIKRRDNHTCILCNQQDNQLDVHHIYDWNSFPCNHPHNLVTLCASCHQGVLHSENGDHNSGDYRQELLTLALCSTEHCLSQDDYQTIVTVDNTLRNGQTVPTDLLLPSEP